MKKISKKFTYAIVGVLIGLLHFTSVSAWGPERPTFTMEEPATYPTFNSITNNPTIGDERDFVRIGQINADVTNLGNEIEIVPGNQYLVYIYYHNNASATFNTAEHNRSGVAFKTRVASSFPPILTAGEKGTISATVTANNSNPEAVWDEAYMTTTSERVFLHYVAGSAKLRNDWQANGSVMPSSLFSKDGTFVGINELNGVIPGCEEYHGVITYVLQADALGGSINKTVSADGQNYRSNIAAKPGDEIYFQLAISNTGSMALTNAVVKDQLPDGLTLVPGSVQLRANQSTTWDPLPDNLTDNGYNLGTIGTGNTVYISYRARVDDDFDCTEVELTNSASLTYDSESSSGETQSGSASVTIKRDDCDEPSEPSDDEIEEIITPEEPTCATNPEMEGCQELPNTGPVQIILAVIIVLGIGGGGYYFYRTHKTLKTVEDDVSGKSNSDSNPQQPQTGTSA